jgi:hypothetical protein
MRSGGWSGSGRLLLKSAATGLVRAPLTCWPRREQ